MPQSVDKPLYDPFDTYLHADVWREPPAPRPGPEGGAAFEVVRIGPGEVLRLRPGRFPTRAALRDFPGNGYEVLNVDFIAPVAHMRALGVFPPRGPAGAGGGGEGREDAE
jgi:hypothetical protein